MALFSTLIFCSIFFWDQLTSFSFRQQTTHISEVDSSCATMWVARAQNDPALTCYLTQKISRFCNPAERKHLAWVFNKYIIDRDAYTNDLRTALVGVQLGFYSAIAKNPSLTGPEALAESTAKVGTAIRAKGKLAAINVETVPRRQIVALIKKLAAKGLIELPDFGYWPDSMIVSAFNAVEKPVSSCQNVQ